MYPKNVFCVFFLKIVLVSGGVFPSTKYRRFGIFCSCSFTVAVVFILLGDVVGILNESNFHLKIVIFIHMFGFTMGLVFHWGVRLNEQTLRSVLSEAIFLDSQIINLTEKGFKKWSILLTLIYWSFHFNFVASTFMSAMFIGGFKDKNSYLVPRLYECAIQSISREHWVTSWISSLCLNIDTFGKYLIVNFFVTSVYLTLLLPYGTTLLFYFFIINYLNACLNVFEQRIKVFSDVSRSCAIDETSLNEKKDAAAFGHLIGMIHYYDKMRGILKYVSPFLSFIAVCNLAIFAYMVTVILTVILISSFKEENWVFHLEYAFHVTIFLLYFAFSCYGGEKLKNLTVNIAEMIYGSPWYNHSAEFQKLIHIFLTLLQMKPLEVTAFVMKVELRICAIFLQRMYSVLNLILTRT